MSTLPGFRRVTKAFRYLTLCALTFIPVSGHAVSIGDLSLSSSLGEPLRASIPVENLGNFTIHELKIRLVDPMKYEMHGLERADYPGAVRLSLREAGRGKGVIEVSTKRPINEPSISFVLEVRWPTGSLYRDFTVLLDLKS